MTNPSSEEVRAGLADAEAKQLRDDDGQIILPEHDVEEPDEPTAPTD